MACKSSELGSCFMRVLVTGARLPAALEICSGLSRLGVEVFAADSLFFSAAGASRTVVKYLRFPPPRFSFNAFCKTILEWVDTFKIDLIIPVSEEIFYLAKFHEEFKPNCALFAPSCSLLRDCHSKWDILALAENFGINVPQTFLATSTEEIELATKKMAAYVIKPEFSRGSHSLLVNHNRINKPISKHYRWLVQEYVTGTELCSYGIAVEGVLLAHATYEPHYRVGLGASLYFKPISNPLINEFVEHFVKKHSFTGQISFDFLLNNEGHLVLLECNPRAISGIHLVAQSLDWCKAFLGEKIQAMPFKNLKPRAAKLPIILFNSIHVLRKNSLSSFISDLFRAKDTTYSLKDPLPFLAQQLCSIEIVCRCFKWKIHPKNAYTFDLEWNGGKEL